MATRKPKAKTTRKRKSAVEQPVCSSNEKKCIRITEADNGFTVSTYGRTGEQVKIAPSMAAALKHTREMMGVPNGKKDK